MKTINSFRSKLLALTFALVASVSTFAYEFEYVNDFHVDGFAYKVLPPTMEAPFGNVALIEIADCTEDVVIPGTVTHEGVTYIVTTLGGGATLFTNSAKEIVKSVFIPKKISTINSPLFADCSNLTSIVVDSRNSYYDSRENCNAIITTSQNSFFTPNMLIAGCKTTTIPNSVTEIADKAFYRSAIESITIPTGVTKIGHSAFNQATLLSSIKLPITLTEIGDWAFADCLSLNTISCYALEPPTISSNTFFGSNPIYNNPSVYVPAYCIEAYKNAEHWIWFTQILPINEPAYKDRWCDTWNVLELKYRYSSYTRKEDFETWQYNLAYDTIIGDYTYTAVTRHTTKVPAGVYPVMAPEPEYVAAVRFTEDKKAFIYYDNTEYLLYDFNAQPGDELTVFAGINHYRSHKTNRCGIGEVNIFPDSNYYYSREISLNVYPNYTGSIVPTCFGITKWIEGVGDICGLITGADCGLSDDQSALLCAYKDGNIEYTTEYEEYAEYGCEYNSGENKEYILTLPGLQRTEVELSTMGDVDPYHLSFKEYTPTLVNGKLYLCDGRNYFREENNQVLLYAPYLGMEEDLVLYDWTLEVGDTLPFKPKGYTDEQLGMLFRVTDVSTIQLLDGKEYKKWTLSGGYEFVEGIGAINKGFGHFYCLRHTTHTGMNAGQRLVCASRNGQLLIDNTEKWGVECQCEVETSYKSQWCDTWNVMWFDGWRFDETASTSKYRLGKDTIIGDYTYSKFTSRTSVRFTNDRKVYVYYEGFDDNDPYTPDLPTGEYLAYDFSAQVGDTLEVFSGVHSYSKYKCLVREVQTDPETKLRTITLFQLLLEDTDGDGVEEEYALGEMTWIEGVGSSNGFLIGTTLPGGGTYALLCAYNDDELKYTGDLYDEYGCEYNATEQKPEDLFPTLWGLQRTSFTEYSECSDSYASLFQSKGETITINDNQYLKFGGHYLREENKQVLLYSRLQDKDLVLYDYSLEVGDTLTTLNIDYRIEGIPFDLCYVDYAYEDVGMSHSIDTLIVTDVSYVTLLDGKEYKKWTFDNGMEYVEGIGMYGGRRNGNFFGLIQEVVVPCHIGTHLVCASRNGKLLYQMDDAEMERLGTECLCEVETSYKSQWCDKWNTLCYNQNQTPVAQTWQYTLGQDTIIEGKTYTIVNRHWTIDPKNTEEYVASVRFTNDDKVFVFYDNTEYLLYDFNVQVDDSVEVFAGINNYDYAKTYKGRVYDISYSENGAKICKISVPVSTYDDGYVSGGTYYSATWIEGIGDAQFGLLFGYVPGAKNEYSYSLLCAYKGDELMHETDHYLFDTYGCEYNGEIYIPRFFEGLQRTECSLHTTGVDSTYLVSCDRFVRYVIKNKLYWKDINSGSFFRETKDQIILSFPHGGGEECVLYDFSLEVGDTLPVMQYDEKTRGEMFRVVDVSMVTLLDGKEYKKWTLACGYEYIEKIGAINGKGLGNYVAFGPNADAATYLGSPLVCASKNGQLLYQMDDTEMERLGAECLCDYNSGPKKDNAKNGKIGGRPTPTQWNQLELDLREMENGNTILRAETFSYTLENDSIVTKGKTFYQLARQSTKDTAITKSFVGALHFGEDEDNRVYFLRDGVEYVLYDFTAEPGDTIEIFAGINNYPQETTYTHVVTGKDTLENGACRMMLEVVFPDETTTATNVEKVWLAGLGSIDGIVHNAANRTSDAHAAPAKSASSETQTSVMLCAWRDDNCLYTTNHPEYDTFGCVYNQDPTAVEDVQTSGDKYQKIIRNGHLYILRDNKLYDVLGTSMN